MKVECTLTLTYKDAKKARTVLKATHVDNGEFIHTTLKGATSTLVVTHPR